MAHYPLEFVFATTYLKKIRAERQLHSDTILNQLLPQDEYARQQGYVQALADADTIFSELMKQLLPEFNT